MTNVEIYDNGMKIAEYDLEKYCEVGGWHKTVNKKRMFVREIR